MACSTSLSCAIIALSEPSLLAAGWRECGVRARRQGCAERFRDWQVMRTLSLLMACVCETWTVVESAVGIYLREGRSWADCLWKVDSKRRQSTRIEARALLFSAQRHFDHPSCTRARFPIVCPPNLLTNSLRSVPAFLSKPYMYHPTCARSLYIHTIYCYLNTRATRALSGPERAGRVHAGSTAIITILLGFRAYRFPLLFSSIILQLSEGPTPRSKEPCTGHEFTRVWNLHTHSNNHDLPIPCCDASVVLYKG